MKRFFKSSLAVLLTATVSMSNAQNWTQIGDKLFGNTIGQPVITISPKGTMFVAYSSINNMSKLNVMMCKSGENAWTQVGAKDFSNGAASQLSITANDQDQPFVSFRSVDKPGSQGQEKGMVYTFNGTEWKMVGNEISTKYVNGTSIISDKKGQIYVASLDNEAKKIRVQKLNGSAWEELASPSDDNIGATVELKFDSKENLYVAYTQTSGKGFIKRYTNGAWVALGTTITESSNPLKAQGLTLSFNSSDKPYIMYLDNWDGKLFAKTFDIKTSKWTTVGTTVATSSVNMPSMAIDNADNIFVAYSTDNDIVVKKFDGTQWVEFGKPGKSIRNFASLKTFNNELFMFYNASGNGVVKKTSSK
jgi:hypothetical protein